MTRSVLMPDGTKVAYAGTSPRDIKGAPSRQRKFEMTEAEAKKIAKGEKPLKGGK